MPRATSAASSSSPAKRATAAKPGAANAKKASPAKKPTTAAAASKKPAAAKKTTTKAPSKATSSTVTTAKPAAAKKSAPAKKTPAKAAPTKAAAKKAPAAVAAKPAATKSTAKPAAPAKKKLSATELKFIESQHELLLKERATYLRQADSLKAEADSLAELREPGDVQFDEESGEGDTLAVERERDLALSHQARAAVEEIDHALTKIELGTYGICEVSGQPIPKERLKAIPWARERVEYKVGGFGRR